MIQGVSPVVFVYQTIQGGCNYAVQDVWQRTGVKVSEVSLGTMAFGRRIDERASAAVLDQVLGIINRGLSTRSLEARQALCLFVVFP